MASTILSWTLRWDCQGVAILNRVSQSPLGVPNHRIIPGPVESAASSLALVKYLILPAILISVIGFVESIVVAKTYASKYGHPVSPNRELVALGMGNIISSFTGAFPGFGSLGRSAVNDATGAKTQLSGFVTATVVLCTIVWLLPYFEFLPTAVCSSIIVMAALKLIELEDLYFIFRLRAWKDLGLLLLTFFCTMFISVEAGTLISVGVSLLLVVKHTTTTRLAIMGQTLVMDPITRTVKTKFRSTSDEDGRRIERIEGGLVIRIEEGMFFGNVGQLRDRLKRIEAYGELGVHPSEEPRRTMEATTVVEATAETPIDTMFSDDAEYNQDLQQHVYSTFPTRPDTAEPIRSVVFDMAPVTDIDATATQVMMEIVNEYHQRGIVVCFVKLRDSCKESFIRSGIYESVGASLFFGKLRQAIAYLHSQNRLVEGVTGSGRISPATPFSKQSLSSPSQVRNHVLFGDGRSESGNRFPVSSALPGGHIRTSSGASSSLVYGMSFDTSGYIGSFQQGYSGSSNGYVLPGGSEYFGPPSKQVHPNTYKSTQNSNTEDSRMSGGTNERGLPPLQQMPFRIVPRTLFEGGGTSSWSSSTKTPNGPPISTAESPSQYFDAESAIEESMKLTVGERGRMNAGIGATRTQSDSSVSVNNTPELHSIRVLQPPDLTIQSAQTNSQVENVFESDSD